MFKSYIKIVLFFLVIVFFSSCTQTKYTVTPEEFVRKPLRVGVTPDYPPIISKRGKDIIGVEADLARRLALELNRPVQFIELRWEKQIPALLAGETDIIMSGMSVTKARKVRIDFSDHYLKSGLLNMMLIEDAFRYNSLSDIMQCWSRSRHNKRCVCQEELP
jgi:ABC-type amino acid transport substrate-binding protein